MAAVLKEVKAPAKPKTIGAAIDALWDLKQLKKKADEEVKRIEALIDDAESAVYELMDAQKLDGGRGSKASVSLGTNVSYSIDDFDAFAKYVSRTKYFHLFQRRVSTEGVRELFETKGGVPGLVPFTKRKINLTTLK